MQVDSLATLPMLRANPTPEDRYLAARKRMKRGDLVLIKNTTFFPGESRFGIFWEDSVDWSDWGFLPEVNCTLLWENQFIPFVKEDLELVEEHEGG